MNKTERKIVEEMVFNVYTYILSRSITPIVYVNSQEEAWKICNYIEENQKELEEAISLGLFSFDEETVKEIVESEVISSQENSLGFSFGKYAHTNVRKSVGNYKYNLQHGYKKDWLCDILVELEEKIFGGLVTLFCCVIVENQKEVV